jgi:hypothetical protein
MNGNNYSGLIRFNRILLSYCVSAVAILLAKIIHVPAHSLAYSDMDLVRPQIDYINSLAKSQSTKEIERMRDFCNEIFRRAQIALYGYVPQTEAEELAARPLRQDGSQPPSAQTPQVDIYSSQYADIEANPVTLVRQNCTIPKKNSLWKIDLT